MIATLPAQEWKPPLPAYDFLSMMDAATFQHPTGKAPTCTKELDVQEGDKGRDESTTQRETTEPMRTKHWNRNNWFKQAEKSLRREKEL